MKLLVMTLALLAILADGLQADDVLTESQRESLVEQVRTFQKVSLGKAMRMKCSTEIKLKPQVAVNNAPEAEKVLRVEYSLVTDGNRFRGLSNSDGKRIEAYFDGQKSALILHDKKSKATTMEKNGLPPVTRIDVNVISGPMIVYAKSIEQQKSLDDLLAKADGTFVVSFLEMADEIVETNQADTGKILEAKIDMTTWQYTLQLRGKDGACIQFKSENAEDKNLIVVSNRFSADDKAQLLSSSRTVRTKGEIVIDATTNYDQIEFVEPDPALFVLKAEARGE